MLKIFPCIVIFLFICCGCASSRVKLAPDASERSFNSLAILPIDYPSDVQREKIDMLKVSLESELRNAGFTVLNSRIIREVCSSPSCPERHELASKYDIQNFASLNIRSVTRANFLAGFYNAVAGKLIISDKDSNLILDIDHTESERGGLVFNSGQVIQGLISYAENKEAESFAKLSTGFAQALVGKIPQQKDVSIGNEIPGQTVISDIRVRQIRPEVFEICADASADSLVSVVVSRYRTNLRSIDDDTYCGTFLYSKGSSESSKINVEARSPFGDAVSKEISLADEVEVCNIAGNVLISEINGKPTIEIACLQTKSGTQTTSVKCEDKLLSCPDHKFIVFRATSNLGPYEKIGEFKNTSWSDNAAGKSDQVFYELVSVNRSGIWSLPVAPKSLSQKG